jgi:hypothetical protein
MPREAKPLHYTRVRLLPLLLLSASCGSSEESTSHSGPPSECPSAALVEDIDVIDATAIPELLETSEPSLAIDDHGAAHVVYVNRASGVLGHATNDDGAWRTEPVASDAKSDGWTTSSVASRADAVHVAYIGQGSTGPVAKYAQRTTAGWSVENIASDGVQGFYGDSIAVALDPAGAPHVFFFQQQRLMHAVRGASGWNSELVDAEGYFIDERGILFDETGAIHVAYFGRAFDLSYATNESGSWQVESIDDGNDVGMWASIAQASNGTLRITYTDASWFGAQVATGSSGSWQISPAGPSTGREPTMLMREDVMYMASLVAGPGAAGGALFFQVFDGSWRGALLTDENAGLVRHPSIAMTKNGMLMVLYWETATGRLRIERFCMDTVAPYLYTDP